jgi:hypothetical protein
MTESDVAPARHAPVQETITLTLGAADAATLLTAWRALEDKLNEHRGVSYLARGSGVRFNGGASRPGIRLW